MWYVLFRQASQTFRQSVMTDDSMSDLGSNCSDISYQSDIEECSSVNIDISNGPPLNVDNFNVVHYNINSITAEDRIQHLSTICQVLKLDALVLTESKLDSTIPSNILSIPGYHEPIRKDRPINGRSGGGVMIYISDSLAYQQQYEKQSEHFDHIWVDVKAKGKTFAINALYRPPNENCEAHEFFLETTSLILQRLHSYKAYKKIIASDLNFGNVYCKQPNLQPKPLDNKAPDLFASFGFTQLIDIPTRITDTSTSLIDLFYVDSSEDVVMHGTLPKIADHDGIFASFNMLAPKPEPVTKQIYDYKNCDIEGLKKFVKDYDFETHVFSHPTTLQAEKFTNILVEAITLFIPLKTITFHPKDQPWCNTYTRLLLRKKNRNYQIYKKINNTYINYINGNNAQPDIATKLAKKRTKALNKSKESSKASFQANRRAKSVFFNSVNATMNNHDLSPKRKFNILLKLMKNNKVSATPPLIENGESINDSKTKSNLFNDFFASKSKVDGSNDASPILEKLQNIDTLNSFNTSPFELSNILENLKKSNFSHCGVPGKFLSLISTPISEPLSKLFNNLFKIGHFPDIWKIAHITAIYKKSGQKSDKSSYRPISLLPTLSKVFESVIHRRMLNHLTQNNLISERQAAYLKDDSTISQLIYLVHTIRNAWGQGNMAQGVFLDISSAFDKVWHKGLLAKLLQIRVEDTAFNLFQSYLSERKQVVVVEGTKSETLDVEAGVPQGSRLGPLLFIIFINDITNDLESEITIFADDTTLLATGKDPNLTSQILNRDLLKISDWAERWKVTFNAKKSKDMIFSSKCLHNSPPTILNETVIDRVSNHKHLGLILTSNLDWSAQVNEVCLKANRKLAVLKSVKLLSRKTLDQLYKITVRSVIDYALPVYFKNIKQTDMGRLNRVQYNAAKVVSGALHLSSIDKLNKELGWETINDRAEYLGITFFHKVHLHETRPLIRKYMN